MEITETQLENIRQALETIMDLSGEIPRSSVFKELVENGGGYEINGIYYGDDEASLCWSLDFLCRFFNVEPDIIKRYGLTEKPVEQPG